MQNPPPILISPGAAPLAVQQLGYSQPPRRGRPGLVTAMGVISTIVASLSLLFSLQTGLQAIMFLFLSRYAAPRLAMTAPPPPTVTTSTSVSASSSVFVSAGTASAAATPATAPSTALTPAEVQNAISKVQANLGARNLNAAQVAALQAALQNPSQQLVVAGTAWSPVRSSSLQSNGTAYINLSAGYIQIDAKGTVVSQASNANPLAGFSRISVVPCILGLFDAVASILLAVVLLVAGIAALRHSRRSLRLHQFYAWAKMPIAVIGGVAYGWTMSQMLASLPGLAGSNPAFFFVIYAGFIGVLGCAYPIGLLITLRARVVRGYYHSIFE